MPKKFITITNETVLCIARIVKNQCVVHCSTFCADVAHDEEPLYCAVLIVKNQCVVQNLFIMKNQSCAKLMMKNQSVVQFL